MTTHDRAHILQALHQRIATVASRSIPTHIVVQLGYALADADVVYLDTYLESDGDLVTGDVVAFTERHVVILRMNGSSLDADFTASASPTALTVLPRTALASLAFTQRDRVTESQAWGPRDSYAAWPAFGRVALTYSGLHRPVILPQGEQPEGFAAFYPSLLDDLDGAIGMTVPSRQDGPTAQAHSAVGLKMPHGRP